jgi:hypothetical protein
MSERFLGVDWRDPNGTKNQVSSRGCNKLEAENATLRAELELLIDKHRKTCACGKDTASLKWAQCYNCRQEGTDAIEEVERLRADMIKCQNALANAIAENIRLSDQLEAKKLLIQCAVPMLRELDVLCVTYKLMHEHQLILSWLARAGPIEMPEEE